MRKISRPFPSHSVAILLVIAVSYIASGTKTTLLAQQADFNALKSQYDAGTADKRIEAITKLAESYKTVDSLSVVKQAALDDADPAVRVTAVTTLGYFAASGKGLSDTALDILLESLADKDSDIRKKSTQTITSSFKKDATYERLHDYIIKTARKDPTHSYEVLSLILNLYPSKCLALFEELSKENDNCRYAVVRLLNKLPPTSTTTKQTDENKSYNESVARLTEIFLKDELPEIRREAVRTVSDLKFYPLIKKALPLISDKNPSVNSTAKESLRKLADKEAAIYWVGALSSASPEIKSFTIEIISNIGRTDTFPYVFAMLDDKSPAVRESASKGAMTLFSRDYVFLLLNELSSPNRLKRKTALEILATSRDNKIIPALLSSMAKERDREILNSYTTTITALASVENIMDLRDALSNPRYELRICAARALAGIIAKNPNSADVYNDIFAIFLNHIKYEKNPEVQKEMLTNAFPSMNPVPYRLAYPWTKIASKEIKILAAEFLARYGVSPESTEILMESLAADNISSDQEVSWRIKDAIEKLTRTSADAAEVSRFLSSKKKEMQLFILGIMKKLPSENALRNLELIDYKKADTEVKYAAIEAVRAARPREAPPILSKGITDKNPEIRWVATKALSEITNVPVTEEILSTLADPNPAVREETLKMLARNPRFEYAARITPLLSDPEISVRRAALEAIQNIIDRETVRKKIIPMLTDTDPTIRALAARICGKTLKPDTLASSGQKAEDKTISPEDAALFEVLRKIMSSDLYPECRREAATALWKMQDKSDATVSLYFSLIKDSDPETRRVAEEILDSILVDKTYKPHIIKSLLDENIYSRSYALKTISRLHLYEANPELFNLVKMTRRGNKKENQALLDTLSNLIDENDVPSLEDIYNMGNPELKLWAIEQAGHLKSEGALNLITRALKEENPAFRTKAVESLVRTSHPEARAALKYIASSDPDPVLRKMAQEKLSKNK